MEKFIDRNLQKGCKKRDRKSQKELCRVYYSFSMKISLRYAQNQDEALEIVNAGFMKVFYNIDRYDSSYSFTSWLSTIMINIRLTGTGRELEKLQWKN